MSEDADFVLKHLGELEELAETVLTDKHQIVDLDRKRNSNREALRALSKQKPSVSDHSKKAYVCFGNTFLKLSTTKIQGLLQEDQKNLDEEINKLRDGLKPKVSKLRDMEGQKEAKGFNLTALSPDELKAVSH